MSGLYHVLPLNYAGLRRGDGPPPPRRRHRATAPAWRDFAQRNAELAAILEQAGLADTGDADDH